MSDRPKPPEQIGDAIARALDLTADAAKREIWRRVTGVLVGAFELKAIDVLVDPTDVEVYMPDGRWCWARTVAWQVDPDTGFPLALWLKVSDDPLDWEKIWPTTIATADDHQVGVSTADITAGKWGPLSNKARGDNITVAAHVETDPTYGEQLVFSAEPVVQPVGGSWLYTGSIQASNLHDPVKAFVKSLEGMGGLDPGQSALFNVVGGTYEHKVVGQLYGLAPDGTETFEIAEGQRVWLSMWLDAGSTYRGGFCTVTTLGDGSTKAVLTPTADDIVVGSMFKVEGVGAEYENWYWEVLSVPANTLAYRPDYVSTTTYNLFTSTEVSQAGSVTRETSVTIPGETSGGTMFVIPLFEMLNGIGVSKINKGVVNWEIKAYVVSDDPAATVFIRAFLSLDQGILSRFGYGDTPPIHNTSAVVLECQGTIAADIACNPTDKLSAVFYGYSNSASSVTVKLVYNDASHSTRVQTPLEVASYGTLNHQLLTASSRGFDDSETADAHTYCHPQRVIAPGRILGTTGSPVYTEDGILFFPAKSNSVVAVGDEPFLGISPIGWPEGSIVYVEFGSSRQIVNDAPVGGGPLAIEFDNAHFATPDTLWVNQGEAAIFQLLSSNKWTVLSAPWIEAQRWRWPIIATATIETGDGAGVLVIPDSCSGAVRVTGTELRAIAVKDADGNVVFGKLAGLRLHFVETCTIRHLDALSGLTAPWIARAAKLHLLPPIDATGTDMDLLIPALRTVRLYLDQPEGGNLTWYIEVQQ